MPMHKWAVDCANLSEAAALQGKFDEMSKVLFAHQDEMHKPEFGQSSLMTIAKEAGLDMDRLDKDIQDDKVLSRVKQDQKDGDRLGVKGTPCFFLVNHKTVWQFNTIGDLEQVFRDPKHPIWNVKS